MANQTVAEKLELLAASGDDAVVSVTLGQLRELAAAETASATARSIFALIKKVCARGGYVSIGADDTLNPRCGYDAIATWPDGSRNGHRERAGSCMYEPGPDNPHPHGDHTADPIEALARLAAKVAA